MKAMQVSKFKDYITEAKKDFLRLLIITDEPDNAKEFHTADRLKEECDKLNYPYYLFKLTGGYTTYEDGIRKFHNQDDKKGFEVGAMTVAVIRGSITRKDSWLDFVSILERANATLVENKAPLSQIKVLPFKEKNDWNLVAKYNIGKKPEDSKNASTTV